MTLNPNADLQASTSYTATVKGGAAGAKKVAGNPLASDVSWTFATTAGTQPPENSVLPSVFGQVLVGQTLTVSDGTWSGAEPITLTYQWLRCTSTDIASCTAIPASATSTYVVMPADLDFRLRATVTAMNAEGSASATSNATSPVKH